MSEDFERFRFAGLSGAEGGRDIAALPARLFDLFVVQRDEAARDRRRLPWTLALGRRAARLDLAVI